jgi:hypothetical protein
LKVIEIVVSPMGETKVETKGFVGNECQKASEFLVGALGDKATEKLKPEFHAQVDRNERIENSS